MARKLKPRQERFVAEYLIDLNAGAAAVRAGYKPDNARQVGYAMLQQPHIAEAIAQAQAEQLKSVEISAARVLEGLGRVAFSDLAEMVDPATNSLLPLHQMPARVRAAIASVKLTKKNLTTGDGVVDDIVEIKLWPKVQALELLAKHYKLLTEVVQIEDADAAIAMLKRGRERVAAAKAAQAK